MSRQLYTELSERSGIDAGLQHKGILAFYKTEKAAEDELQLVEAAAELGLDMGVLNPAECRALQPQLELDVLGAVHYRCDSHLTPMLLMSSLQQELLASGVSILPRHEVTEAEVAGGAIKAITAGGKRFMADKFVLAAGSWSPAVAAKLGIRISLMPGKGYSFMRPDPEGIVGIPALLCEARVAITPMNGQIRYGGTMELGRMNDKVNMKRVEGIVSAIPRYFPGLRVDMPAQEEVWYGYRPSSPDGLPYIGHSRRLQNVVLATGHGMMGLSLGPATGLLVSELVEGKSPSISVSAFSPDRL